MNTVKSSNINSEFIDFNHDFSLAVNTVKGFAIVLVVIGHISSPLGGLIFSFHMPLFFFLSGLYINTSYSIAEYFKRNFNKLATPYLIFGSIGWGLNYTKNILLHRPNEDLLQSFIGLIWWMNISNLNHYGFVLWFLSALFFARIATFLVYKYMKIQGLFIFFFLVSILIWKLPFPILPFGIDKAIVALPWVVAATIFNHYKFEIFNFRFLPVITFLMFLVTAMQGLHPLDMALKNVGVFL